MLQGGRLPGMSLVDPTRCRVDPTRDHPPGRPGKNPLAGKGPITRQVAQDIHRHADEQSRAAVGRAFVTSQRAEQSSEAISASATA